nr:MAG TPA: hypothetical protein [Caudoviricetes sp.]DAO14594.1 MAG TPA: hypothetical protein [Caudoviricetes sp.]
MHRPCSALAAGDSCSPSLTASDRRAGRPSRSSTTRTPSRRSREASQKRKRQPTTPRRGCVSRHPSCASCRTFSILWPAPSVIRSLIRVRSRRSSSHSRMHAPITFTTSEMKP